MLDLVEILTGRRPQFKGIDAATAQLAEALDDKQLLLVIDDVWNEAHVRPFLQGGGECTRLITTRNDETLPPNTHKIDVDAMRSAEAVQLLAVHLAISDQLAPALATLAARLGEWPLLLNLANGALRRRVLDLHQAPAQAIDYIQRTLEKGGITRLDLRNATDRSQAVALTIDASLELLHGDERSRFAELAIFPEEVDIPLAAVARLWGATAQLDDLDTENLCETLHSLSLLQRFDPVGCSIRLHDVIRTYLREQSTDLPALQRRFLAAYGLRILDSPGGRRALSLGSSCLPPDSRPAATMSLRALFASDDWLNVRVPHDDYSYDGYIPT